jgi:hypothetical protein
MRPNEADLNSPRARNISEAITGVRVGKCSFFVSPQLSSHHCLAISPSNFTKSPIVNYPRGNHHFLRPLHARTIPPPRPQFPSPVHRLQGVNSVFIHPPGSVRLVLSHILDLAVIVTPVLRDEKAQVLRSVNSHRATIARTAFGAPALEPRSAS